MERHAFELRRSLGALERKRDTFSDECEKSSVVRRKGAGRAADEAKRAEHLISAAKFQD